MRCSSAFLFLLPVSLLLFFGVVRASAQDPVLWCEDIKKFSALGSFMQWFSTNNIPDFSVSFYLATNSHREPVEIIRGDAVGLQQGQFDPAKPTYIVIHGFKSGGLKGWVLKLKDALLNLSDVNIILVDWSKGSYMKNYVNSARSTVIVKNKVFNFLQFLRGAVAHTFNASDDVKWNHLYFIGHSLGAQISAKTSYLLRDDDFWSIDRITGLDPAKPCFADVDNSLRLDQSDAKFIDIIHTQIGKDDVSFGVRDRIGHLDFYINGGVQQPECASKAWYKGIFKLKRMICSHRLSYKYFTESLMYANSCKFVSYHWDGSYEEARDIFERRIKGRHCADCPEMGFNAPQSRERGAFLVITSEKEPHCELKEKKDYEHVPTVLKKLRGRASIFT